LASFEQLWYPKPFAGSILHLGEMTHLEFAGPMDTTLYATESARELAPARQQLSDEELLLQYRDTGERELFAELVRRYERELYSYLKRYLASAEMAEDAFQAVFLQVHLKCDQFQKGRRVRPWLYAITTNQAIDTQRRNRRHRMVSLDHVSNPYSKEGRDLTDLMVSGEPDPLTFVGDTERNELLQQAMDQLSDQMRSVVHLVYYQGLKYREAADIMSIPVGTVKSRLHAAVAKLAEFWNRNHPDLD
jgi:RNA polymerase sigma-70 factor (ECF subfamily)